MRAIVVEHNGGPEVLRVADVPDPLPTEGQVVVDVSASGVNFRDVYERDGRYPASLPFIPGSDGAGTVSAMGEAVTGVRLGDRVAWCSGPGSYAERVAVDEAAVVPVPDGVSAEVAAAVLLQGLTAHYLATSTHPVASGDVVLVHAAAGGVGLLLTQIAKLRGGRVIGTVSTPEKAELARAAGADEVIDYSKEAFALAVRDLTDGQGAAVVYDGVGKDTFEGSLLSLRRRGLYVLYGASSGPVPPVDLQILNRSGSLFATRPTLGDYTATREELLGRCEDLFGWIAAGALDVRIGGRYPLGEAARAHEDLQARRTTGKLLLVPK